MLRIAERVLEKFENNPAVVAIRQQAEAEAFAEVQANADERDLLQQQIAELRRTRTKKVDPQAAVVAGLRAKLAAEEQKLRAAERDFANEIHMRQGRIDKLNDRLRAAADPRIMAAAYELYARYDRHRHQLFRATETPTDQYNENMQRIVKVTTNSDATMNLLALMREAKAALEALTLQNPADVEGAIASILAPVNAQWQVVLSFGEPVAVDAA